MTFIGEMDSELGQILKQLHFCCCCRHLKCNVTHDLQVKYLLLYLCSLSTLMCQTLTPMLISFDIFITSSNIHFRTIIFISFYKTPDK